MVLLLFLKPLVDGEFLLDSATVVAVLPLVVFHQVSRIVDANSAEIVVHRCVRIRHLPVDYQTFQHFALFLDIFEVLLGFQTHFPFFVANFIHFRTVYTLVDLTLDSLLILLFDVLIVHILLSFQLLLFFLFLVVYL